MSRNLYIVPFVLSVVRYRIDSIGYQLSPEENDLTMTPKSGDLNRMRMRMGSPNKTPSPRTNDASIPPPATATASSSANCSFDEAGSARTSLSRNGLNGQVNLILEKFDQSYVDWLLNYGPTLGPTRFCQVILEIHQT